MSKMVLVALIVLVCSALFLVDAIKHTVIVTGAAGRTGSLVFSKLLGSDSLYPVAIVRSESSAKKLLKISGVRKEQILVSDVTVGKESLVSLFNSIPSEAGKSVIMCTSAVPKIKILSVVKLLVFKLLRKSGRPEFYFKPGQTPYDVDYLGAQSQIEASKDCGINHFVFLSSMGGTQPDNFLNTIGKVEGDEKSGNILMWKRKAEKCLIASGLKYSIVHPGGLTDKKSARSEIVLGFDDELLKEKVRSISRADVATVCIQSLQQPGAANKSFDIISKDLPDNANAYTDWRTFFAIDKTCVYAE